jgi:hypothetical protein
MCFPRHRAFQSSAKGRFSGPRSSAPKVTCLVWPFEPPHPYIERSDRVPPDRLQAAENAANGGRDESPKLIFDNRRTANCFGKDQLYYVSRAGRDRIACRLNGGVSRQQQEPTEALHQCGSARESLSFGRGMSILRSFAPLPRFPASIQWLPARVSRGVHFRV